MPGTPLRIAVSMTVDPTSASTAWETPEASMNVIFGIMICAYRGEPPARDRTRILYRLAACGASVPALRYNAIFPAPERNRGGCRPSRSAENLGNRGARLAGGHRQGRDRKREIAGSRRFHSLGGACH